MCACVAAYGVYLGLPLILGALAIEYGFSDPQIGWIGAAENAGMLLGSLAVSWLVGQVSYRRLAAAGIVIAMAGNAATVFCQTFGLFCAIRLVTGIGSGLCYSAAIAALSLTRQSSRNFSIFIVILVIANSLELWTIPGLVTLWNVRGIYTALGLLYVVPLMLIRRLPDEAVAKSQGYELRERPGEAGHAPFAWSLLSAVILFNVAASAFWAYAERIGASIGLSEAHVADTLTVCNLFSLTGSMLAYGLSRRWGQYRPYLAAIALMIAVYGIWSIRLSTLDYIGGVLVFFEVWSMASVFQLATLTGVDPTGRHVALFPAAQGIGQSAGPFLAAALLGWGMSFPGMLAAVTLFAIGSLATNAGVYLRLRRVDPQVAAA